MTKEATFQIIVKHLTEILPDLDPAVITLEHSMKDLGANSIDRADVLISTMEELKLRFPPREAGALKSIGELVDFLYTRSLENAQRGI